MLSKDKDKLIEAIKKSVTEQLMGELEDAVHLLSVFSTERIKRYTLENQ